MKTDKRMLTLIMTFGIAFLLFSTVAQAESCGIKFLTSLYAKRIQSGMQTTKSFSLINTCNDSIVLKEYEFSGTVLTPEGEKPVGISEISLGEIPGKGETKITIDIDTVDVEAGLYSPHLSIVGDHSGELITATLAFEITVVGSVAPPSAAVVSVPPTVYKGDKFMINATGIPSGATISLWLPYPEAKEISVEQTDTQWLWTGSINETGSYTVYVLISSAGVLTFKGPYTIESILEEVIMPTVVMDLHPANPRDGTTVRISVLEKETNKLVSGCDIYIDGDLTDSIVADAKSTYDVRIECKDREIYTSEFSIPALDCFITLSKEEEIFAGEEIELTALSSDTYAKLTGTFTINDKAIEDTWEAKEGKNEIVFENDKFTCLEEVTVDKNVLELESTVPEDSIKPDTTLTFLFNRETDWKIKNENNVTVLKNSSKRIDFTTDKAGSYTILAEGEDFGTFSVKQNVIDEYGIYIFGFVAIIVVGGLVIWRLKRRQPEVSFRTPTAPKTPPGAAPVE